MKRLLAVYLLLVWLCSTTTIRGAEPRLIAKLDYTNGLDCGYVTAMARDSGGTIWLGTGQGLFRTDGIAVYPAVEERASAGQRKVMKISIGSMAYDPKRHGLWLANPFGEVYFFDLTRRDTSGGLKRIHFKGAETKITGIKLGTSGTGEVWFATLSDGLLRLNPDGKNYRRYSGQTLRNWPFEDLRDVEIDAFGKVYVAAANSGLLCLDPATGVFKTISTERVNPVGANPFEEEEHPRMGLYSLHFDHRGYLWVTTPDRLALFDTRTETFQYLPSVDFEVDETHKGAISYHLPRAKILAMADDSSGSLWTAVEGAGINIVVTDSVVYNPLHVAVSRLRHVPGQGIPEVVLSNKSVYSLLADSMGNVFAGTNGDGVDVMTIKGSLINILPRANDTPERFKVNEVRATVYDQVNGELWVGTDGGGINILSDKDKEVRHLNVENSPLRDGAVLGALRASDGSLWFGTYSGRVYRRRPGAMGNTLEDYSAKEVCDVRAFAEMPDGRIAAAASNAIMIIDPLDGTCECLTKGNNRLRSAWVRDVAVDPQGRIYAAIEGGGVDIYSPQQAGGELEYSRHLGKENFRLPSNFVGALLANPDGSVIIGSSDNLVIYHFDTDSVNPVSLPELPAFSSSSGTIRTLMNDRRGNLWVVTANGIARYTPTTGEWEDYTHLVRGRAADFSPGAAAEGAGGRMYFGSHGVLVSFEPGEVEHALAQGNPMVRFSVVKSLAMPLGGEHTTAESPYTISLDTPTPQEVKLTHRQNSFSVNYSIDDPYYAPLVEYAYRMEGLGKGQWIFNGNNRSVEFQDLPCGRYTLYVRAHMAGQPWGQETGTALHITILPPIWLTWQAWVVYVFLAAWLVWLIGRMYRRRVHYREMLDTEKKLHQKDKTVNEERMRFFTNITHELRTPLSLIIGPIDDLTNDAAIPTPQRKKLLMIQRSATRLLGLINSILEFRKTETQNKQLYVRRARLDALVSEMGLRYGELNANPAIAFSTDIEEGDYDMMFDPDAVTTILDNLLSNAFKYTKEGEIHLRLRRVDAKESNRSKAEISVSDTGIGILAKNLQRVFDRYFQDHNNPDITSTGIGLALVKNLADLHKAQITVESVYGHGSTFSLILDMNETYPEANHSKDVAMTQQQVYQPEMLDGERGEPARRTRARWY